MTGERSASLVRARLRGELPMESAVRGSALGLPRPGRGAPTSRGSPTGRERDLRSKTLISALLSRASMDGGWNGTPAGAKCGVPPRAGTSRRGPRADEYSSGLASSADRLRLRKGPIHQPLQAAGIVLFRAALAHGNVAPAYQGFDHDKEIGGTLARIFVIAALGSAWSHGQAGSSFGMQDDGFLIEADQRVLGVSSAA
jgi:hypothetical protein